MNVIEHKFLNSKFFFPFWEIETLVLGTFNPCCGEETDYYYGRCQNNFWKTIEEIKELDYRWFQNNFDRKYEIMQTHKFGCVDIIKSIEITDEIKRKDICGSGYSDQILFNSKNCMLEYNFEKIEFFIKNNNNLKKVINTWGKRNKPKLFNQHISFLKNLCENNNIKFISDCPSPSGRLKGIDHKQKLLDFYKIHIFNNMNYNLKYNRVNIINLK
jgi:hypothetical protein